MSNGRMGIADTTKSSDPEIRALAEAMDAKGFKKSELGRLLGIDASQVTRIFDDRRRIQRHEWRKVESWLGQEISRAGETSEISILPGMVPLYGWAGAASDDHLTLAQQTLLGAVPRHPNQANIIGAYALKVAGDSMVPRYEPGETIYIAPNQWPSRDQDCVLVTKDDYGYLKRYVGRDAKTVTLTQFNPPRDWSFEKDNVAAVHAVVGRG
ncbi:S24 family peptidase [Brevundimonas sp.]|uniref:S24 family peptidase n=1 Tax=Brevundimonas sp. TaxID=1871086 RepID=UPI00286C7BEB|nr:S24 family peptidase [Brevundimonas sp.]